MIIFFNNIIFVTIKNKSLEQKPLLIILTYEVHTYDINILGKW